MRHVLAHPDAYRVILVVFDAVVLARPIEQRRSQFYRRPVVSGSWEELELVPAGEIRVLCACRALELRCLPEVVWSWGWQFNDFFD